MRKLYALLALALVMWALPAHAFTPISSPDAAYLGSTNYIDFSAVPTYTNVTSITDGTLTVSFGMDTPPPLVPWNMNKRVAPGDGWATWSAVPHSQRLPSATLPVLFSNGAVSLRFQLSSVLPVLVFGFEAEPNPFHEYAMTAAFYDASDNLLGTITRNVHGNAGARLFAASSPTPISYVIFSSDVDWAVGAFRYSVIPEPTTMALFGLGLLAGIPALRRRR